MKKLLCTSIMLLLIMASCSFCFASNLPDTQVKVDEDIIDRYIATSRVSSKVVITGSTASYYVKVDPQTSTSISYIDATLKLVKSNGTVVKTTSDRLYLSGVIFSLSDSKALSTKGGYHTEYILKVYKSGRLVETIRGQSSSDTY